VLDDKGRFVAHDKFVLSMKDNNQSENLEALVNAGVRSFKIEGRYKDLGYVKNITAHYRKLIDSLLDQRPEFSRSSSGNTTFTFTPDPDQNFNREFTDYFVQGRKIDIGAVDSPKNPGKSIGYVAKVNEDSIELKLDDIKKTLSNGDGLCFFNLQNDLVGLAVNRAEAINVNEGTWRVFPKDDIASLPDLRKGVVVNRNRDVNWTRILEKNSSIRRIPIWLKLDETENGFILELTDEDGNIGTATISTSKSISINPSNGFQQLSENLTKFGNTIFELAGAPDDVKLNIKQPWFIPASLINSKRREAVENLEISRRAAYTRPPRSVPVNPPAIYPEDTLTYLANAYNEKARDFYSRHGVKVVAAAYESHEEEGEVSLMITKHCVRFSMSMCPKQAKGVTGVQGTVKAEPLTLINGKDKLTLRFDCKPCEMHVIGRIHKSLLQDSPSMAHGKPIKFYQARSQ
jgi:putative protease